jgi:hypothetical protein
MSEYIAVLPEFDADAVDSLALFRIDGPSVRGASYPKDAAGVSRKAALRVHRMRRASELRLLSFEQAPELVVAQPTKKEVLRVAREAAVSTNLRPVDSVLDLPATGAFQDEPKNIAGIVARAKRLEAQPRHLRVTPEVAPSRLSRLGSMLIGALRFGRAEVIGTHAAETATMSAAEFIERYKTAQEQQVMIYSDKDLLASGFNLEFPEVATLVPPTEISDAAFDGLLAPSESVSV